MNKERYNQIIDEAYIDYAITCIKRTKEQEKIMKEKGGWLSLCLTPYFESKEEFITKCKNDVEFSQKWNLQIKETYDLIPHTEDFGDVTITKPIRRNKLIVVYKNVIIDVYE